VRTAALEHIVKKLEHMSIRSLTISEIKEAGEGVSLFKHYTIHDKIEIMVPDNKADEAARAILGEKSNSGTRKARWRSRAWWASQSGYSGLGCNDSSALLSAV
jgi:hypothetical protein